MNTPVGGGFCHKRERAPFTETKKALTHPRPRSGYIPLFRLPDPIRFSRFSRISHWIQERRRPQLVGRKIEDFLIAGARGAVKAGPRFNELRSCLFGSPLKPLFIYVCVCVILCRNVRDLGARFFV